MSSAATRSRTGLILGLGVVVIILCILSFVGGTQYQKGRQPATTATATGQTGAGGLGGRSFARRGGIFGAVTAVSDSTITVQDTRTNTSKILTIDSSTTVTNSGAAAAVSDIKVGDTVMITASTTDATKAAAISLNPSFGGQGGMPGQAQPTPTGTQSL